MEFDAKKVLTPFTENGIDWIGWKGYFGDKPDEIERKFKANDKMSKLARALKFNYPFYDDSYEPYMFFYPIEPPKKKEIRPYKDIRELANEAFGYYSSGHEEYELAAYVMDKVIRKKNREYLRIDACDMESNRLKIQNFWYSLELVCKEFVWADGSPCGVEE